MDAGRVDPGLLTARIADARGPAAFVPGQRLSGRVVENAGNGQFVLAFGDRRVAAQSALPLVAGQRLDVDVIRTGGTIELRLVTQAVPPPPVHIEQQVALATVLTALRSGSQPRLDDPAGFARATEVLRQLAETTLPPDEARALVKHLVPLPAGSDPQALAAALREQLETGGLLFESRLRALLIAHPELAGPELLALLRTDLKALLTRVARRQSRPRDASDGAPPQEAGTPEAGAEAVATMAGRVHARQLASAAHWLADGSLAFEFGASLPLGPVTVRVRLQPDERSSEGEDERTAASSLVVRIEGEEIGTIEARARWGGDAVRTLFTVDREATRELLLADLDAFTASMRDVFAQAFAEVCVDPRALQARAGAADLPVLTARSIVDVRA